ncbi:hypothetical protein CWC26_01510 [Pseudoalteromonas sp. S4488]|uniref:hypothetical protein n=1 Tax=unclassified Pseudoalteromonas TaxID=194690 RepID=UPI0007B95FE7|nr:MULTISPECIES: hypothetical protein [unclassified Pseudoalteromonas]KZY40241.1 hypothetical protein A3733_24210 [Pseudoalteromonas shioyasakiensis]RZF87216.1 hypothetical protein EXT43_04010 [Pseudoalteromonas sp. CO109Y]TMO38325.1 hypothetical protein CWC27_03595 [Pseudoalteromonas sp. S4491]TMO41479.1 hypothetical protein CWC26_01510 [Pseudoalteromonas sp. S4488]
MKHYTLLIISLFLSACGGGGEGSSSTEAVSTTVTQTPTTSTPPPETTPPDTSVETETMADLTIAPQFDLSSKIELNIDVDLNMGDSRAYLNICLKGDDNKADYDQCLLRAPLKQSKLTSTVMLANSALELVAEVWFYDSQNEPLRFEWQYDGEQSAVFTIR